MPKDWKSGIRIVMQPGFVTNGAVDVMVESMLSALNRHLREKFTSVVDEYNDAEEIQIRITAKVEFSPFKPTDLGGGLS